MMVAVVFAIALGLDLVKPPKQPDLGFAWHGLELRSATDIKIRPAQLRESAHWVRLYGIDVPAESHRGYSGARLDLEILLGRDPILYTEDEDEKHPISRNAACVQYVWTRGKLIQFELLRDGWATVNDEGRKGRYAQVLIGAEAEARRFHSGMWAH